MPRAALQPVHALMSDDKVTRSAAWPKIEEILKAFGAQEFAENANVERYAMGSRKDLLAAARH